MKLWAAELHPPEQVSVLQLDWHPPWHLSVLQLLLQPNIPPQPPEQADPLFTDPIPQPQPAAHPQGQPPEEQPLLAVLQCAEFLQLPVHPVLHPVLHVVVHAELPQLLQAALTVLAESLQEKETTPTKGSGYNLF